MAKRNWMNEILGGQILINKVILQNLGFVLFIFVLVIMNIMINFGMERSLIKERRNQRELKHLKADYITKMATLQYNSKKTEVEKKLQELGSTLKPPIDPPIRVIMEK